MSNDLTAPRERKQYDKEVGMKIIERIAGGETLKTITNSDKRYPSARTFYYWLAKDSDFRQLYQMARELSAYAMDDEALDAARSLMQGTPDGDKTRAMAEMLKQLRWSAEKRNQAMFGANARQAVTVPIVINTTLDLGAAPGAGTKEFPNIYEVKVEQEDETEASED